MRVRFVGRDLQVGGSQRGIGRTRDQIRDVSVQYGATERFAVHEHVINAVSVLGDLKPEAGSEVALRIQVHDEAPMPAESERGAQVDRRGGLANPPLLVDDRQNPHPEVSESTMALRLSAVCFT